MEIEKKPWWVSEQEVKGLGTVPAPMEDPHKAKEYGAVLGKEIQGAVPQMKMVTGTTIMCEYGEKDGLLNYHFYFPSRYAIRMEAEGDLEKTRSGDMPPDAMAEAQNEIAKLANHALERNPWPEHMEDKLRDCFRQVFKYSEFKVDYFIEVDSFSVVMPESKRGLAYPISMLEEPISLVDKQLSAS